MCGEHRAHSTDTAADPPASRSPGPRSPAEVREAVRQALDGARRSRGPEATADATAVGDVLLVASELTTNAMLHGGGVTAFEVIPGDREVRLSVSDRSEEMPTPVRRAGTPGSVQIGGHGWPIICLLARDIMISILQAGGKRITAVVPLSPG
ncbi:MULTISPECIES: ATP-binding protein [unclassified Streptomyces]|uniref:ATP-binding protein n=1 Tax=unclassified Streptomyces TaxID=2593676 RepID=UPI0033A2F422|nr:ATP-binding protein [Streptomyces sp. NBC_01176]